MEADNVTVQTNCLLGSTTTWSIHSERQEDKKYNPTFQTQSSASEVSGRGIIL